MKIKYVWASIDNEEKQCYFFHGHFTDFACHGVPSMTGWKAVVLIIRQERKQLLKP